MAEFSTKERMIAAMLSAMPGVKKWVKRFYIRINAIVYHKKYKIRLLDSRINNVYSIMNSEINEETFFGYYDKCCCYEDNVLFHQNKLPSSKLPDISYPVSLYCKNIKTGVTIKIGESKAYNWQQGSRLHWVSKDRVLFNVFNENRGLYQCVLYDTSEQSEIKRFDKPVQESYHEDYFLSINYRRLWNMRPDYCYRCLPKLSREELKDNVHDGIFYVDIKSGEAKLLHSISDVIKIDYRKQFDESNHNVNHLMLSPNGKRFIFIHRNYEGKRRFDRLMISDFSNLKVVIDEHYVSHCCWIDNSTIVGYLKYRGEKGFFFINVDTLEVRCCQPMTDLHTGDGHPSYNGRFVAFDTYPDKSRMQKLYLFDFKNSVVISLLELYQSARYEEECRCDLHPRFSKDGDKLFFDTVYHGHRELCWVNLKELNKM